MAKTKSRPGRKAAKKSKSTTRVKSRAARVRTAAKSSRSAGKAKKTSSARRKVTSTRRAPAKTVRATTAAPKPAAQPKRPPQTVAVSHYNNADFESGLRTYAQYRDLGIVEASNGMVRAHVLRFVEPCDPRVVSKLHFHDTEFQMVYVLKGWVKTELEGEGEIVMRQGSAWTQPPNIRHKINDYSEDAELLEIILPADFETVELAE